MEIRNEIQLNPVADRVLALTAVVRPILRGVLYGLREEMAQELGGRENVKLFALAETRNRGDGDTGVSFEYAIHDAIDRRDGDVLQRVADALALCNIKGDDPTSILFGAEKAGAQQLIETTEDRLTDDSLLLYGTRGHPVKLKRHISGVAQAFRKAKARESLPTSIDGLWKADLFLGDASDRWVGGTVKIQRAVNRPGFSGGRVLPTAVAAGG